jgi:hypothetical protein
MKAWNQVFWLAVIIAMIKLSVIIFSGKIKLLQKTNLINKVVYGLASRKDLAELSDGEFIAWCIPVLQYNGISEIQMHSQNTNSVLQLSGYKDNRRVYIRCVNLQLLDIPKDKPKTASGNRDDYQTIGSSQLRELIGLMEHDGIDLGLIITNGNFSTAAEAYAKKLITDSCGVSLELIDGCKLTRLHRSCQKDYALANNTLGGL